MIYAQINQDNKVVQSVVSKVELGEPWILVEQDSVSTDMVYNETTKKFEEPSPG
jgi:hypothetical protein